MKRINPFLLLPKEYISEIRKAEFVELKENGKYNEIKHGLEELKLSLQEKINDEIGLKQLLIASFDKYRNINSQISYLCFDAFEEIRELIWLKQEERTKQRTSIINHVIQTIDQELEELSVLAKQGALEKKEAGYYRTEILCQQGEDR